MKLKKKKINKDKALFKKRGFLKIENKLVIIHQIYANSSPLFKYKEKI